MNIGSISVKSLFGLIAKVWWQDEFNEGMECQGLEVLRATQFGWIKSYDLTTVLWHFWPDEPLRCQGRYGHGIFKTTSWHGRVFCIAGLLCGESISHGFWIYFPNFISFEPVCLEILCSNGGWIITQMMNMGQWFLGLSYWEIKLEWYDVCGIAAFIHQIWNNPYHAHMYQTYILWLNISEFIWMG